MLGKKNRTEVMETGYYTTLCTVILCFASANAKCIPNLHIAGNVENTPSGGEILVLDCYATCWGTEKPLLTWRGPGDRETEEYSLVTEMEIDFTLRLYYSGHEGEYTCTWHEQNVQQTIFITEEKLSRNSLMKHQSRRRRRQALDPSLTTTTTPSTSDSTNAEETTTKTTTTTPSVTTSSTTVTTTDNVPFALDSSSNSTTLSTEPPTTVTSSESNPTTGSGLSISDNSSASTSPTSTEQTTTPSTSSSTKTITSQQTPVVSTPITSASVKTESVTKAETTDVINGTTTTGSDVKPSTGASPSSDVTKPTTSSTSTTKVAMTTKASNNTQNCSVCVNTDSMFGKYGGIAFAAALGLAMLLVIALTCVSTAYCRQRSRLDVTDEEENVPRLKMLEIRDTNAVPGMANKPINNVTNDDGLHTYSLDYEKHVQEKIEEHKKAAKPPAGATGTPIAAVSSFLIGKRPSTMSNQSSQSGANSPGTGSPVTSPLLPKDDQVVFNFIKKPGEATSGRRGSALDAADRTSNIAGKGRKGSQNPTSSIEMEL